MAIIEKGDNPYIRLFRWMWMISPLTPRQEKYGSIPWKGRTLLIPTQSIKEMLEDPFWKEPSDCGQSFREMEGKCLENSAASTGSNTSGCKRQMKSFLLSWKYVAGNQSMSDAIANMDGDKS